MKRLAALCRGVRGLSGGIVAVLLLAAISVPSQSQMTPPGVPAAARVSPYCFGATGDGCSQLGGPAGRVAYCRPALGTSELECMVSAGSIEHDSCCFLHPQGRGCSNSAAGGAGNGAFCAVEWDKAQDRLRRGLYWTRRFSPQARNTSGVVDFNTVCAPAGTIVAAGDQAYCCGRQAVPTSETDLNGIQRLRCR
ncbi:hypothetical protein E4T66_12355 [Sinimarinibacterium sp. CAU 1509]|uniref:hypothetical protein n=1 Tax=Sinimarinibacterium sp. CAU 1509 TaxID=2562283 RepID=UPI0010AC8A74|nr:hypothetical protein [Sinimarinibacterium sp. CAU 1509]TJY59967.1 hypothetical protein E4T66_12355 [Sinimarinibacterium sp. CAU 1509]